MGRKAGDWLESYLKYSDNSEPSALYRLWSGIAVISSALQRKVCFEWGELCFYPNMFIVLVGPPAARKGTAMDMARPFLDNLDVRLAAEATTRESLIRALAEASFSDIDLEKNMTFHNSLTVWAQELTVFLGYQNHQLMSDMTDWFDCRKKWTYRTKNMGTDEIKGIFVTLFGATTPTLIRTALPVDAVGSGLTSRMVFVYESDKGKLVPYPGLTNDERALGDALRNDIEQIHLLSGKFKATKEFFEYYVEWYVKQNSNRPFKDDRFAGYFERRATHVMKLCIIVNAARTNSMTINKDDLIKAINIIEKTEVKMANTFSGFGRATYADVTTRIMGDIATQKTMLFSDILRAYRDDVDQWNLEKIMNTLSAMKFVKSIELPNDIRYIYIDED